ncbi:c-type cytochrome biogenesis protein CcmI [Sulfurirhabdus autotrophica]|uniref:Cytochrome c-type biogenesis protein CcmH n=1 Tax=Sulfurirhabdus autotrophica TaxID=1706046 RepID=A0A4R3YC97_9PROT|nr:c-type cytochrome biogenesis protein CcmI [Sulfurirhabdus autotrophica]TCV89626.1 cytochrome c-type biogenesis protein CcmH [Sulfurirhabdus autotrophica]
MVIFWIISGLMMVSVLAFLIPPLLSKKPLSGVEQKQLNVSLYREQMNELEHDLANRTLSMEHYDEAKSELEQRMMEDVSVSQKSIVAKSHFNYAVAITFLLLLPGIAIALYVKLGSPQSIDKQRTVQAPVMAAEQTERPAADQMQASVIGFVERLKDRLNRVPDDTESWVMLSRSYVMLKQYPEAVKAFERATKLVNNDATLLADYADALAMAQGRSLEGKPEALVQQALKIHPENEKALYLAGTASYNRRDYKNAVKYWEKLYALLPPGKESNKEITLSILDAKARTGDKAAAMQLQSEMKGLVPDQPSNVSTQQAGVVGKVSGVVEIAPALKAKLVTDAKLFVFARAANGSRMPLAILSKTGGALPLKFQLTDDMAMTSKMKLSSFEQVQVVARLSKSGSAAPQSGDLEGYSKPVKVGSESLRIMIDHEVP